MIRLRDQAPPKLTRAASNAVKRQQAMALRCNGASYKQIAEAIGVSLRAAWRHVDVEMARLKRDAGESAEKIRDIEIERLDLMLVGAMPKAKAGDPKAIQAVLNIQERRSRYLGLDVSGKQDGQEVTIEIKVSGPPGMLEAEGITARASVPASNSEQYTIKGGE